MEQQLAALRRWSWGRRNLQPPTSNLSNLHLNSRMMEKMQAAMEEGAGSADADGGVAVSEEDEEESESEGGGGGAADEGTLDE